MENQSGVGNSGSPSNARASGKRKRNGADFDQSSPGTGGEEDQETPENRRTPGVKRACNECRQQKVSHTNFK